MNPPAAPQYQIAKLAELAGSMLHMCIT